MSNYCILKEEDKEHLLNLIDWLFKEVLRSSGDGDALWYSRYYDIKDILPLVQEYNSKLKYPWEIKLKEETINWSKNQESFTITNDKNMFIDWPSWGQVKIQY